MKARINVTFLAHQSLNHDRNWSELACSINPMPIGDKKGLFRSTILEEDFPLKSMMQCDNFVSIYLYILTYIPIDSRIIW